MTADAGWCELATYKLSWSNFVVCFERLESVLEEGALAELGEILHTRFACRE